MYKWRCVSLLCFCCIVFCSCGSERAGVPSSFMSASLLKYQDRPEDVLTLKNVADIAGVPVQEIAVHVEKFTADKSENKALFSWDSGQVITVGGNIKLSRFFSLGITHIRQISEADFTEKFGSVAGLQQRVDRLAADSTVSFAIAQREAQYLAGYAESQTITEVDNVGERAYWEMPLQVLHVYVRGAAFTITANFGDEEALNKRKAVAFSRSVFENLQTQ